MFHCKISKIEERLYLGDMMDAQNRTLLHKLGITHILNMATESPCFHAGFFTYKHITAQDTEDFSLDGYLDEVADFIDDGMRAGGVLVHCAYGISRGTSAVLAYLIKYKKMGFLEARSHVQARRSHICPNEGFVQQLKQFQKRLGVRGNVSRAERLRKHAEMADSIFGGIETRQKELKKKFRLTSYSMSGATGIIRRAGNSGSIPASQKESEVGRKRLTNLYSKFTNGKIKEKKESDLAEFGSIAKNMIAGHASMEASSIMLKIKRSDSKNQGSLPNTGLRTGNNRRALGVTHMLSHDDRGSTNNMTATYRFVDAYCCSSCGRILAQKSGFIPHSKNPISRCDKMFITKQNWMKGDTLGKRKNLFCPNMKCRRQVGEISENEIACGCGFSDNPSCTLYTNMIEPVYRESIPPNQKEVKRPLHL